MRKMMGNMMGSAMPQMMDKMFSAEPEAAGPDDSAAEGTRSSHDSPEQLEFGGKRSVSIPPRTSAGAK